MTAPNAARRVRKTAPGKTPAPPEPTPLTADQAPLVPLFSWAGGKTWAAPMLLRITAGHEHRTHVELFCGALGVSLALRPKRAVINDLSPYLVNLYQQIQARYLTARPLEPMTRVEYFRQRDELERLWRSGTTFTEEFASLFLTVMRGLYRGFYKEKKDGTLGASSWNGKEKPGQEQNWDEYAAAFYDWIFTCGEWAKTPYAAGDLVIADPPYYGTWDGYASGGFPYRQQAVLALAMADHDGPVVLHNDEGMHQHYRDMGFQCVKLTRTYAAPKGPKAAVEVVAVRGLPLPTQEDVMSTMGARAWLQRRAREAKGLPPLPVRKPRKKKVKTVPVPAVAVAIQGAA